LRPAGTGRWPGGVSHNCAAWVVLPVRCAWRAGAAGRLASVMLCGLGRAAGSLCLAGTGRCRVA